MGVESHGSGRPLTMVELISPANRVSTYRLS
jgi:hypothetical protein